MYYIEQGNKLIAQRLGYEVFHDDNTNKEYYITGSGMRMSRVYLNHAPFSKYWDYLIPIYHHFKSSVKKGKETKFNKCREQFLQGIDEDKIFTSWEAVVDATKLVKKRKL